MKPFLVTILISAALTSQSWAHCGNDCHGGPAECGGCDEQGSNPFTPYSGSVSREVTDLEIFGGIGEEKLAFKRKTTSRYKPGIPTPLGTGGSWRHSYYWNIVPAGTDAATGGEIIHIDYPDGSEKEFKKQTATSLYLTGVSATQERIEQLATDPSQYDLWFPDGRHLRFRKIVSGATTTFQPLGMYDKHGDLLTFIWDTTKKRVTRVTEPGGRFIQINYGSIGNFNIVDAHFVYDNPTAMSAAVVGETSLSRQTRSCGTADAGHLGTRDRTGSDRSRAARSALASH